MLKTDHILNLIYGLNVLTQYMNSKQATDKNFHSANEGLRNYTSHQHKGSNKLTKILLNH
jgi:hypothetical protein